MTLREYPVWVEGLAPPVGTQHSWPAQVDLAVIGGGIAGLAAAREAARRGMRVALFEARSLGWGASSRNGGMVLTGLKLDAATLVKRYGQQQARRMYMASLDAIACVGQIVAEEQINCDFRRCGHLIVASKPAHYNALKHDAELVEKLFGHATRPIPADQLASEIGSQAFHGGAIDEASASIQPARFVYGLAQAAARAGALLFDHTPVTGLEQSARQTRIKTGRGNVIADRVIVATGGYTGAATPALRRTIIPIGSYIIATEPLSAELAQQLIPHERMIYDTRHFLYYFRLSPDRRMVFGGRAGFFPETASTVRQSAIILRKGMLQVFPQLRDVAIEYAWGGTIDFTFDMMPHAGQSHGMYHTLGYAGHGVAMASYHGTMLAAQLAGAVVESPFAAPLPGAPLGLYTGQPWFLPFAGAWYWLLDLVS